MKTETLLSQNEMIETIAIFHGWTKRKIGKGTGQWYYDFGEWGRSSFAFDNLKYTTSWDWIMPVWIKFRELDFPTDSADENTHHDWINSLQWYLFSSDEPKRFAERMAYAIKWFNTREEAEL